MSDPHKNAPSDHAEPPRLGYANNRVPWPIKAMWLAFAIGGVWYLVVNFRF
ncbi:MAG: hypothetical protein KDA37_14730 [Planctomycetales bacterium]|nr:hypothetical protein [Planctomycetales bacterium]